MNNILEDTTNNSFFDTVKGPTADMKLRLNRPQALGKADATMRSGRWSSTPVRFRYPRPLPLQVCTPVHNTTMPKTKRRTACIHGTLTLD